MKNLIISLLATYIFYTQFCVIEMPYLMPIVVLMIWGFLAEIDCYIEDFKTTRKRGEKLQRKIRRLA